MTSAALAERVKATGHRLGFDLVAIGPADPPEHGAEFEAWLDAGYAGTMGYLERSRAGRLDPRRVLPGARSVVACALNYYQGAEAEGPRHVARYAWGTDYHAVMEPRLHELLDDIVTVAPGTTGRVYVDTGPVLERAVAARAGLGWVGKNTMLLHPALGSYFFIGVILTTAELAVDSPLPDRCGTCTRCLEACPTGAFPDPYVLDARRCISYLTIEQRGPIPPDLREGVGTLAFGCDICQAVCPWNRRAPITADTAFVGRDLPALTELVALSDEAYRERLRESPLRRARRNGLVRNAAVALGNGGDPGVVPALAGSLANADPMVRGHIAWALGRLKHPQARAALEAARASESDAEVLAEIDRTLAGHAEGPAVGRHGDAHVGRSLQDGGVEMAIDASRDALIVVDVQNDFCPGGALAVSGGDQVVPVCNRYIERFGASGASVFATRDWHPPRTKHFLAFGGAWPPHCVQDTPGAAFHPALAIPPGAIIVSKGMDPEEDAYSGFQARDAAGAPFAAALAKRGVRRLYIGGLATDYCVKATALDAVREGFEVLVLADAIRAVDVRPGDGHRAITEMREAGARFITLEEV